MLLISKLLNKRVSHQKGFTLLELLMVIAVIGILASLAVPRFSNATARAKFTEVVNAAGPYKSAVELCIIDKGAETACDAGSNRIPAGFEKGTGKVTSVTVVAGVITITGNPGVFGTEPSTYELTPTFAKEKGISWSVGGTCTTQQLC